MSETNTLVTFLGKGRDDRQTGYRTATYRFPDGSEQETPFFGLALANHLNRNPDKHKDREEATKELNTAEQLSSDKYEAYQTLNALRNTMAHGTRPKKQRDLESLLGDREKLRAVMQGEIARLLD